MTDDVAGILASLEAVERDALALAAPLSTRQFTWQPDAGRAWSVANCLDHLTASSTIYIAAMAPAAARAAPGGRRGDPVAPGWFARWFIRQMEPPIRRRFKAPSKIVPAATGSKDEVLQRFGESQAVVRRRLEEWADLDLNRIRFVNPLLPVIRYQLGAGFLIIAAHNRRHVWQARRVVDSPSFPR